ncbi:MAG: glycosyltransferase family 4 protein [Chloroflexota bacterium]|nr:glycosyltransferase family 4 protein [Chloroflexota bacterium]
MLMTITAKPRVLVVSDKVLYRHGTSYYTDGQTPLQLEAFSKSFNLHILMPVFDVSEEPQSLTKITSHVVVHALDRFKYFLSIPWPWKRARVLRDAKKCFSHVRPQVVIGKFPREVGLYGVMAAYSLSIPTIVNYSYDWYEDIRLSVQGYPKFIAGPYEKWVFYKRLSLARNVCRMASAVTSVSQAYADSLANISGRDVVVARNAYSLSPEFFEVPTHSTDDRYRVTYIGRIDANKNIASLLHAIKGVRHRFPEVQLSIAGDGPGMQSIRDTVTDLGLCDTVDLLGYVKHDKLPQVLEKTAILVLPSIHEALGQVLLEAMAASRAVVASRTGGITDLVRDRVNGLLIDPLDISSICTAICDLLDNWEKTRQMGVAGNQIAQQFKPELIHDRWIKLVDEAIGG